MTFDELDALPDASSRFGVLNEMRNGTLVRIPVLEAPFIGVMWQQDDDGIFPDRNGDYWMTGWYEGVRYRRRFDPRH